MKKHIKASLRHCVVASVVVCVLLVGIGYGLFINNQNQLERVQTEEAAHSVLSIRQLMHFEFEGLVADVRLLSNMHESQEIFEKKLTSELAKNLLFFALDKKTYDNIRYIDLNGRELFRIDYRHGNPQVVAPEKLRISPNSIYYKESKTLKVGRVYVSRLDLDTEYGIGLIDPKPILRIAAPMFSQTGKRVGVVMLNYFGKQMLRILDVGTVGGHEKAMLLNQEGYWLRSDNPDDEWGFMRPGNQGLTYQSRYPEEWKAIQTVKDGEIMTDNGLFAFATIDPGDILSDLSDHETISGAGKWTIVVHVPNTYLAAKNKAYLNWLATIGIPLGSILIGCIFLLCLFRQSTKKARMEVMDMHASNARFVPTEFLNLLGAGRYRDLNLKSHAEHSMAVMFSDIRSYTALSESMTPQEVIHFLNEYFAVVNTPITDNKGFVDSFHGDALLALFHGGNAQGAVRAALAMQQGIAGFNKDREEQGLFPVAAGIGIHYGDVTLGALGTDKRMQATVIGDCVNLAARIESATKLFGVRVIISDCVYDNLDESEEFHIREIDTVRVKGKQTPVILYEIFDGDPPNVIESKQATLDTFSSGLAQYRKGDFEGAASNFHKCSQLCPEDTISPIYFTRCKTMMRVPPGEGWTGVTAL